MANAANKHQSKRIYGLLTVATTIVLIFPWLEAHEWVLVLALLALLLALVVHAGAKE